MLHLGWVIDEGEICNYLQSHPELRKVVVEYSDDESDLESDIKLESEPQELVECYEDKLKAFNCMVSETLGHHNPNVQLAYVLDPMTKGVSAFCSLITSVQLRAGLINDDVEKLRARFGKDARPKWYLDCAAYHWRPPLLIVS